MGMVIEVDEQADAVLDDFYLWLEHVPALKLWGGVQTQWRHGFHGPTGLDYAGVRASPAWRQLRQRERERAFADVCVIERAWLVEAHEQRQRNDAAR